MTDRKRPRPRAGNKTSPRRLRAVERQAEAIRLRAAGQSLKEIAHRLGYAGRQGAGEAIQRGLRATVKKPADTLRTLDLMRLDKLLATHYPRACRGDHAATASCLHIMERQARLLGLDAPVRTAGRLEHAAQGGVRIVATIGDGIASEIPKGSRPLTAADCG